VIVSVVKQSFSICLSAVFREPAVYFDKQLIQLDKDSSNCAKSCINYGDF
jgi:hypothetical protein